MIKTIAIIVLALAVLYLWLTRDKSNDPNNQKRLNLTTSPGLGGHGVSKDTSSDNSTCTITDAYGRSITLTGGVTDPQFQALCQLPNQQQVYLYNYPYFIRRRHNGHPHPHGGGGMGA